MNEGLLKKQMLKTINMKMLELQIKLGLEQKCLDCFFLEEHSKVAKSKLLKFPYSLRLI